jgi:hypothetical protein
VLQILERLGQVVYVIGICHWLKALKNLRQTIVDTLKTFLPIWTLEDWASIAQMHEKHLYVLKQLLR